MTSASLGTVKVVPCRVFLKKLHHPPLFVLKEVCFSWSSMVQMIVFGIDSISCMKYIGDIFLLGILYIFLSQGSTFTKLYASFVISVVVAVSAIMWEYWVTVP